MRGVKRAVTLVVDEAQVVNVAKTHFGFQACAKSSLRNASRALAFAIALSFCFPSLLVFYYQPHPCVILAPSRLPLARSLPHPAIALSACPRFPLSGSPADHTLHHVQFGLVDTARAWAIRKHCRRGRPAHGFQTNSRRYVLSLQGFYDLTALCGRCPLVLDATLCHHQRGTGRNVQGLVP